MTTEVASLHSLIDSSGQEMNVNLTAEEIAFRDEVRAFFAEKYPADIRDKFDRGIPLSREDTIRWQKILYDQGWFAVNWPEEYGGTGWGGRAVRRFDGRTGHLHLWL
jgi:alkylation response protein AidB-like acyl-CoA dehydrogenase